MRTVRNRLSPIATSLDPTRRGTIRDEVRWAIAQAKTPELRSRVQFAEQCVWIPEGKHVGEKWRRGSQPYAYHLLNSMDTRGFRRFAVTGCVQSGKTLNTLVINCCWHLFEHRHTVVYGVPDLKMARDKWEEELLPVIEASPWMRRFLPSGGAGSKGGFTTKIRFRNGSVLKFMGAQGDDSKRSAFTAQVLFMTEVDRYDEAGGTSREASPAQTMCDRVGASGDDAFIYEECTMTTERGRINQQFHAGTGTELHVECVSCGHGVLPSREHFVGYQGCDSVVEARRQACFVCPQCKVIWSDAERHDMLSRMIPVDRGQELVRNELGELELSGDSPETRVLSMRWNAFHNRFWSVPYLAEKEWEGLYSAATDDEEKQARQKRWTLPAAPDEEVLDPVTARDVMDRHNATPRGVIPVGTVRLSAGVDVRKTQLHFVVIAWDAVGTGTVIDYGIMPVNSKELGTKTAVLQALETLRDYKFYTLRDNDGEIERLPAYQFEDGTRMPIAWTLVDGNWKSPIIREFMRRTMAKGIKGWMHVLGRGQSEPPRSGRGGYTHPNKLTDVVKWIGDDPCYISWSDKYQLRALFANSDWWKTFVHEGFESPSGAVGALSCWLAMTEDELREARTYGQQLAAEGARLQYVKGRGSVWVWRNETGRQNHFFDCTYYACAAAHLAGVRWAAEARQERHPASSQVATVGAPPLDD
mgnify:CR=1 FL=1